MIYNEKKNCAIKNWICIKVNIIDNKNDIIETNNFDLKKFNDKRWLIEYKNENLR